MEEASTALVSKVFLTFGPDPLQCPAVLLALGLCQTVLSFLSRFRSVLASFSASVPLPNHDTSLTFTLVQSLNSLQ